MNWQSITTAILFSAFILMGILLYWPRRGDNKPYKDAEKLALKDDDEIITPRQDKKNHER